MLDWSGLPSGSTGTDGTWLVHFKVFTSFSLEWETTTSLSLSLGTSVRVSTPRGASVN